MAAVIVRRIGILIFALTCFGSLPALTMSAQEPPKEQVGDFEPISNLPPLEQIPAPRLLISAYSFVVVALFLYVVSVARRLTTVQREIERLEADVKRTSRA